ncbi:MAG: serine/threonine protein kinase [Bdellovibrionaceae bacterium]|nr:serine/threonine protein kinase [Pseudobdellovibrionaceae bacterium]
MAQEKFERFGNYILLEKLASGGMAEIYLSKKLAAEGVQKFVAVKRILAQHSSSEDFIRMFKDEAKIAVNLNHGNVVSIYDFGVENNQLFLVMEYMEGKNLRQILNRLKQVNKRFSISHIAYVTKMIAAGLDHAHRLIDATTGQTLNIIHRDMSPQNVMVSFEGEVKIIDFGIAKSTTQEESTRVGTLKGKFGYMSPEQVDGMEVDARTDIFAMGIMVWEMLSEQRLFLTNNEMTTLRKIRDCKIPSLREIDPNIPVELDKIVNKALARNKTQRYQTAAELQKDLQSFLNRYNPDFSSQDFAEFIKEMYSEEIVDARKRQVAYSKVEVPMDPMANRSHKTDAFTQSMTFTSAEAENVNFVDLELKKGQQKPTPSTATAPAPQLNDINHSNLTVSQAPAASRNSYVQAPIPNQPRPNTMAGVPNPLFNDNHSKSTYTHSAIRMPTREEPSSSSSPIMGILVVLIAGMIGIFAVVNETQPKLVMGPCNSIKKIGVPITCFETGTTVNASSDLLDVSSDPQGAQIYLNSAPTSQQTPAKVSIPRGKPFAITLMYPGFKQETLKFNEFPMNNKAYMKLRSIPSGTVVVRIVGGEAYMGNVKVQNGQRISIEANKPITFTAKNALTGASIEKTVTVKVNETKELLLSPR